MYESVLEFPNSFGNFVKYFLPNDGGTNQVIRLSSFNSVISFFSRRVYVYSLFTLIYTLRERYLENTKGSKTMKNLKLRRLREEFSYFSFFSCSLKNISQSV